MYTQIKDNNNNETIGSPIIFSILPGISQISVAEDHHTVYFPAASSMGTAGVTSLNTLSRSYYIIWR